MALQADVAAAFVAALGVERLALLTHDMGDTVGGELLARRAEGTWPVEVTRRVVTNGSIYIAQAHLTNGQQLLLTLPDEVLPEGIPIDAASVTRSLRETFSRADAARPPGLARGPGPCGGVPGRPRRRSPDPAEADPLHRGAAGPRAALHGRHRDGPLAAARRVGPRRPHRRSVHGRHAAGGAPGRHGRPARRRRSLPHGRGAPALPPRRAHRACLGGLRHRARPGTPHNLATCRAAVARRTATSSSPAPGRATSSSEPTRPPSPTTTPCWCATRVRCAGTAACAATTGCRARRPSSRAASGSRAGTRSPSPYAGSALRDRYVLRLIACDRAIHVIVLTGLAIALFTFAAHDQALHHDYQNIMNDLAGGDARRLPGPRCPRLPGPSLQVLAVAPADPGLRPPRLRRAGGGRDGRPVAQQAMGRVPDLHRHDRPGALRGVRAHRTA